LKRFIVAPPLPESTRVVDWLAGASMMVKREVFEKVGLFDEGFFLYFEETDLCRRAQEAGFRTAYVRESAVAHIGHGSTALNDHALPRPEYWFASRRRYFEKNHGRPYLFASNVAAVTGLVLDRARRKVQRMPLVDPPRFLRDFVRFSVVEPKNPT
jgi:GT2 family glycosyltransferase